MEFTKYCRRRRTRVVYNEKNSEDESSSEDNSDDTSFEPEAQHEEGEHEAKEDGTHKDISDNLEKNEEKAIEFEESVVKDLVTREQADEAKDSTTMEQSKLVAGSKGDVKEEVVQKENDKECDQKNNQEASKATKKIEAKDAGLKENHVLVGNVQKV